MRALVLFAAILAGCASGAVPEDEATIGEGKLDNLGGCDGCIDDSGDCIEFPAKDACGAGGVACFPCAADELCSENFECVAQETGGEGGEIEPGVCDQDSCPGGCCVDGVCMSGNQDNMCGSGGDECVSCGSSAYCDLSGVCIPDPDAPFDLIIVSAVVPMQNLGGGGWDPGTNLPDTYVRMRKGDFNRRTIERSNTLTPEFNILLRDNIPASSLTGTYDTELYDDDNNADDSMGSCPVTITDEMLLDPGTHHTVNCARNSSLGRAGWTMVYRVRAN